MTPWAKRVPAFCRPPADQKHRSGCSLHLWRRARTLQRGRMERSVSNARYDLLTGCLACVCPNSHLLTPLNPLSGGGDGTSVAPFSCFQPLCMVRKNSTVRAGAWLVSGAVCKTVRASCTMVPSLQVGHSITNVQVLLDTRPCGTCNACPLDGAWR